MNTGNTEEALSTSGVCFNYAATRKLAPRKTFTKPAGYAGTVSSKTTTKKSLALNGVSIDVPAGKFVALLGANGAGKTTFFSIITGLYAATEGQVHIGGYDLRSETGNALSKIGVVFQRPTLDRDLTVVQNLRYFCQLHGVPANQSSIRIEQSLQAHGLTDFAKRKVTQLSGGQQRRVELARSLLHEPQLLLLDEPTVGLDYENRLEFVDKVRRLCAESDVGVLWATHLMDEVEDADYLYILHQGQIICSGEVAALREIYRQKTVAELFTHLTQTGSRAV